MAIESKTTLKSYFETGDIPTEAQFSSLIDTVLTFNEGEINSLTAKGTPVGADYYMIEDSADSWAKKKVLLSNGITNAVHVDVAGEIAGITQKVTPVSADLILIEDSADSNKKKYITVGDIASTPSRIQDAGNDTYVDVATGDIVEIGSANTGTNLAFKIISDTGGTPKEVIQIDGNGTIQSDGKDLLYFQSNNVVINPTEDVSGSIAGSQNVGIGHFVFGTSMGGNRDIGIGYNALGGLTNGSDNIAIAGSNALAALTTGDYCIGIGNNAGLALTTQQYNILIGNDAGRYITQSNTLIIDPYNRTDAAGDQNESLIYGIFDATLANQTIKFNAVTTIHNDASGDLFKVNNDTNDVFSVNNTGFTEIYANNISTTTVGLLIEQDGTGDAKAEFKLTGGQIYAMGIDNSSSDNFVLAASTDLDTTPLITVKSDGDTSITGFIDGNGFRQSTYEAEDETYAITDKDFLIIMKPVLAATTATLPSITASNDGQIYFFACRADVSTVTVQTDGVDILGNTGSATSTTMTAGQFLGYQASNDLQRWLQISG